jgi:elongation factor 1-gamma
MSFGKLYGFLPNPRTNAARVAAKASNLDVELVREDPSKGVSQEYLRINKLAKVPSFVGSDGFILSECIAICIYFTSQNEKTSLLGKTKQDYANILRWMSFGNSEILPAIGNWFRPLVGKDPYNKKSVDESQKAAEFKVGILEDHLQSNTYLVGERVTLADYFVTCTVARGFEYFYDKAWREKHPNVTRWATTIWNQPDFTHVYGKLELIDTAKLKNVPPKKEEKKEQAKKEQAKKEKPKKEADDEEEEKPKPKPKHPLEELGRPTFVLDEWKRQYSNEETREVALPWFWEHANFDEYSLWQVDYKYNDELTMTFMTANLIGGFFNRLEASRKYLFGAMSVYGKTNDSVVRGAFLARGQEALPAFDVAPDWESYSFTKLDPKKAEDKEFVNDMWAWDKPVEVNGKTYDWADGKVFK